MYINPFFLSSFPLSYLHVIAASQHQVRLLANELSFVPPGVLLQAMEGHAAWPSAVFSQYWPMARADSFGPVGT